MSNQGLDFGVERGEDPKREEKRTKGLRESSEKTEIVNEEEE